MERLCLWLIVDAGCLPCRLSVGLDVMESAVTPSQLHPVLTLALLLPPTTDAVWPYTWPPALPGAAAAASDASRALA